MKDNKNMSNTWWDCKYHVVFILKKRMKAGNILGFKKNMMLVISKEACFEGRFGRKKKPFEGVT